MKHKDEVPFHYSVPALKAYIDRVGAEASNFKRYIIKTYHGNYWVERVLITINEDFSITVTNKEFEPTKAEAEAIKEALATVRFPKCIRASSMDGLLAKQTDKKEENYFPFYSRQDGGIIMVQHRIMKDGNKAYIPWTLWDDNEWRAMEPTGPLPFFKSKVCMQSRGIMIHEGAKAARFSEWLVRSNDAEAVRQRAIHPWAEELSDWDHWGIIGGALAVGRADYDEIRKAKPAEVVYVCDNDAPGRAALQEVSQHYGGSMRGITFDQSWPRGWDMADKLPDCVYNKQTKRYKVAPLRTRLSPATFATRLEGHEKAGRPTAVLKLDFREEWYHAVRPEVFIHKDNPTQLFSASEFNSFVRPFSHVDETARLIRKDNAGKGVTVAYNPSQPPGIFVGEEGRCINTHVPPLIKEEKGDVSIFEDFMKYMIPIDQDRLALMRWCATLIARPDIKIKYGVLLISNQQGVGKSSLGEKILKPLVGELNTSTPDESAIVDSAFNSWAAHKRLAVVHEIYAGHSAKAYNRLKSVIADETITINQKYQVPYDLENWVHVFACSNSMKAIKLEDEDRRWFVPGVTEEKKDGAFWERLNYWLTDDGGIPKLKWWAKAFCEEHSPVPERDISPLSVAKQLMIEESRSPGQKLILDTIETIKNRYENTPVFFLDTDGVELIKHKIYAGKAPSWLETPLTVRATAKRKGMFAGPRRINFGGIGRGFVVATTQAHANMSPETLLSNNIKQLKINDLLEF